MEVPIPHCMMSAHLKQSVSSYQDGNGSLGDNCMDCGWIVPGLSRKCLPHEAEGFLLKMRSKGFRSNISTLSALMLCYANNRLFSEAQVIWDEIVSSSFAPSVPIISELIYLYATAGHSDMMEDAYARLRSSRILIEEEAIRALSSAYIRERKFYSLGKLVENVGLGRRNVGNLFMEPAVILCCQFQNEKLARGFVRIVEAGFHPDLTTFSIRAPALEHMKHKSVIPALVTYGCVVDAYLERRLVRNLEFSLDKMNVNDCVVMLTDEVVFEAMGKGDFHTSADPPLEFKSKRNSTYKELIEIHLKKKYLSNQVFWNYL
ncbi:hypothetical protein M9H77_10426 [Catharanthus roseus]|uniref:Uncharacterized protein n=1 Tax=Catharanthus roseus TaxID=4058 RepID=A0ACC0C3J8_CATRO|nr:hypothetical protein M9H77_10426 [Catharanthus roseus]